MNIPTVVLCPISWATSLEVCIWRPNKSEWVEKAVSFQRLHHMHPVNAEFTHSLSLAVFSIIESYGKEIKTVLWSQGYGIVKKNNFPFKCVQILVKWKSDWMHVVCCVLHWKTKKEIQTVDMLLTLQVSSLSLTVAGRCGPQNCLIILWCAASISQKTCLFFIWAQARTVRGFLIFSAK